jgi:hypothetical protein
MTAATIAHTTSSTTAPGPPRVVWVGRMLSAIPVLFLTFDTTIKVLRLPMAVEATQQLGFTAAAVFVVGVIELVCLALYVMPRTAILGAVLWIGYFGGAIATHLRAGSPLLTHTLFPIVVAGLLWGGLWLRDERLKRAVRAALGPA